MGLSEHPQHLSTTNNLSLEIEAGLTNLTLPLFNGELQSGRSAEIDVTPYKAAREKWIAQCQERFLSNPHDPWPISRALTAGTALLLDHFFSRCGLPDLLNSHGLALAAVGGYGAERMGPRSDIDLVLMGPARASEPSIFETLPRQSLPIFTRISDFMRELGLEMVLLERDHSDISELFSLDNRPSLTSLLAPRFLSGIRETFDEYRQALHAGVGDRLPEVLSHIRTDLMARHLEPGLDWGAIGADLKNGFGGLRDADRVRWLDTVWQIAGNDASLLEPPERDLATHAATLLQTLKLILHFCHRNKGAAELMRFGTAEHGLAAAILAPNEGPARQAVLIQEIYATMADFGCLVERLVERAIRRSQPYLATNASNSAPDIDRTPTIENLLEQITQRVHESMHNSHSHSSPADDPLSREWFVPVRSSSPATLPDTVRHRMREFLSSRGNVAPALERLAACGALGAIFTVLNEVAGFVDQAGFHSYTVDRHSLHTVRGVDKILANDYAPFVHYAERFRAISDPLPLYGAALLHDSGKLQECTSRINHAVVGAHQTDGMLSRIGCTALQCATASRLVADHLVLAQHSQRSLTPTPQLIRSLAERAGSPEYLAMLFILTAADKSCTNPPLWTASKELWLQHLYERVHGDLTLNRDSSSDTTDAQLAASLRSYDVDLNPGEISMHLAALPQSYRFNCSPETIVRHISLVRKLKRDAETAELLLHWGDIDKVRRPIDLVVVTPDAPGLLRRLAAALNGAGFSISSATVFTRSDGVACNHFQLESTFRIFEDDLPRFERKIRDFFYAAALARSDSAPVPGPMRNHPGPTLPSLFKIQPDVFVHPIDTEQNEVMFTVRAADRTGLLFTMAASFEEQAFSITAARLSTGNRGVDNIFLTTTVDGKPITPATVETVRRTLHERLCAAAPAGL